jgi:hypothetical protein
MLRSNIYLFYASFVVMCFGSNLPILRPDYVLDQRFLTYGPWTPGGGGFRDSLG